MFTIELPWNVSTIPIAFIENRTDNVVCRTEVKCRKSNRFYYQSIWIFFYRFVSFLPIFCFSVSVGLVQGCMTILSCNSMHFIDRSIFSSTNFLLLFASCERELKYVEKWNTTWVYKLCLFVTKPSSRLTVDNEYSLIYTPNRVNVYCSESYSK